MTGSRPADRPDDLTIDDVPQIRACLSCRKPFHSHWAGERVCKRCKTTAAWRDGRPPRSHPRNSG